MDALLDAYWFMRQWRRRVMAEEPPVSPGWVHARWQRNRDRIQDAVHALTYRIAMRRAKESLQ